MVNHGQILSYGSILLRIWLFLAFDRYQRLTFSFLNNHLEIKWSQIPPKRTIFSNPKLKVHIFTVLKKRILLTFGKVLQNPYFDFNVEYLGSMNIEDLYSLRAIWSLLFTESSSFKKMVTKGTTRIYWAVSKSVLRVPGISRFTKRTRWING